jgi:hypothetical protein
MTLGIGRNHLPFRVENQREILPRSARDLVHPDHQPYVRAACDSRKARDDVALVGRRQADDFLRQHHHLRARVNHFAHQLRVHRDHLDRVSHAFGFIKREHLIARGQPHPHRRDRRRSRHPAPSEQHREGENSNPKNRRRLPVHAPAAPIPCDREPRRQNRHHKNNPAKPHHRGHLQQR